MPPSRVDGKDYPETVLLRMIDPKSGPLVKLSAAVDGAGLMLTDDSDRGVLVYARDGKVLRTNHIPVDRQAMSGYEEAGFVRDR